MQSFDINDFNLANGKRQEKDVVIPQFYKRPVLQKLETEKQGRPIYKDIDYVKMVIPGDRNFQPDVQVKEDHKYRWPKYWEHFNKQENDYVEGTRLSEWPAIPRSTVEELKHYNVLTVEQLAELNENAISNLGAGSRELQKKAQAYLKQSDGQAILNENIALKDQLSAIEGKFNKQAEMLNELREALASKAINNSKTNKKKS